MCCCRNHCHSQRQVESAPGDACCCHAESEPSLDRLRHHQRRLQDELASVTGRIAELEERA
jgi:hypothetical protein